MIMADVLKIFLLIVGSQIVFVCYWLLSEALFSRLVTSARDQYREHPFRITLYGIFLGIPPVLLGIGILNGLGGHPIGNIIGGGLILATILLGIIGSAGLANLIGSGLPSQADDLQPWKKVLRGGVVLAFTFLLPFVGWFVLLPWTVVSGFGAVMLSFQERRKRRLAKVSSIEPAAA